MPDQPRSPIWAGRSLALVAILLLSLNLRTAVAMLSPIVDRIGSDLPIDGVVIGVLGMVPLAAFAASGVLAPALARWIGLEASLACACLAMVAGHAIRGLAPSAAVLIGGTLLTFVGMGIGNVLLPPVVKRYFPDRIALLTTTYVVAMAVSATVPAVLAVPVAERVGWRLALAAWAGFALLAFLPWIALWLRHRRKLTAQNARERSPELQVAARGSSARLRNSALALSLTLLFTVSALNVYSMYAWLPVLLIEHVGVSTGEAGAMMGYFALLGLPLAFVVPVVAAKARAANFIVLFAVACLVVGYLGLLLAPDAAPWAWITVAGIGPAILFPVLLLLFNTRTRTTAGSIALSGFVQGFGYAFAALGPLLIGYLHELVGQWPVVLLFLLGTALLALVCLIGLSRPGYLEDELAR